ncbi:ERAP1-like C-terminal domain-containing protein, partial [Acidimicrobiaceae bacterium]|nr:ERAP1-like C-terminal domain-containing protein [Acidimicrobiaceae bacterium]
MSLRTEKLNFESFLKLIDLYKNESDKNIWSLVSGIFATLHKIDSSNELENYIAQFCKPLLDKLGSEYKEGTDQEMSQLKSLICFLYAKYSKDDKFISHFTDQFNSEKY